jgi:hypothetical protein
MHNKEEGMNFSEVVEAFRKSGLGEVEVDVSHQSDGYVACATLSLKTSAFEGKGLAEAFIDLGMRTASYVTAFCYPEKVEFRVYFTSNQDEDIAPILRARAAALLARADAAKAEDAAK